jgi:hypothetical protein
MLKFILSTRDSLAHAAIEHMTIPNFLQSYIRRQAMAKETIPLRFAIDNTPPRIEGHQVLIGERKGFGIGQRMVSHDDTLCVIVGEIWIRERFPATLMFFALNKKWNKSLFHEELKRLHPENAVAISFLF